MTAFAFVENSVIFTDSAGTISTGKRALGRLLESQFVRYEKSELSDLWLAGDTVIWTAKLCTASNSFQRENAAVVQRGLIVSFSAKSRVFKALLSRKDLYLRAQRGSFIVPRLAVTCDC